MSGLAIFLIVVLTAFIASPKSVGQWRADCKNAYENRLRALQQEDRR